MVFRHDLFQDDSVPFSIASSHIICPNIVIAISFLIDSNSALSRNFAANTYRIASILLISVLEKIFSVSFNTRIPFCIRSFCVDFPSISGVNSSRRTSSRVISCPVFPAACSNMC